ncbi:hypothetical protein CCS41_08170 [Candidatus Fukatsuia symbiotica]|uniref:Uncharacterized protein n=2 Tax=Candidatus Fukatsuia symbiotica TaxID=1878942 RepID=A0A2U8I5N1_9GAMM|nr:hypothetical protein CCS41_08170 [Candidatus Fukatsuia symbiotica]
MNYTEIENKLSSIAGDKYILVFSGFSGLGYENPAQLEEKLENILDDTIRDYGRANILVVAGATEEGIGTVYRLAKAKGIAILGIVSEEAEEMPLATNEQETVLIPDPGKTWKVLDENGHSYMVNILQDRRGVFYALGEEKSP